MPNKHPSYTGKPDSLPPELSEHYPFIPYFVLNIEAAEKCFRK
jgi:hypothetical protein